MQTLFSQLNILKDSILISWRKALERRKGFSLTVSSIRAEMRHIKATNPLSC